MLARVLPYWEDALAVDLRSHGTVLVSAHGNSLRALVKHLDAIPDDVIAHVNLPTGVPLLYELDSALHPVREVSAEFGVSGTYLDAEAARLSIREVKAQGRTSLSPANP